MERIAIAASEEVGERTGRRFRIQRGGAPVEAFVVRFEGRLRAWVNRCTHRQVELDLGRGDFFHPSADLLLCRAHGATFDVRTGACSDGPCPRGSGLEPIPVGEEDGRIWAESS